MTEDDYIRDQVSIHAHDDYYGGVNPPQLHGPYRCLVCAFDRMANPPRDYNICPRCGTEFGNDDADKTHAELYEEWVAAGRPWLLPEPELPNVPDPFVSNSDTKIAFASPVGITEADIEAWKTDNYKVLAYRPMGGNPLPEPSDCTAEMAQLRKRETINTEGGEFVEFSTAISEITRMISEIKQITNTKSSYEVIRTAISLMYKELKGFEEWRSGK